MLTGNPACLSRLKNNPTEGLLNRDHQRFMSVRLDYARAYKIRHCIISTVCAQYIIAVVLRLAFWQTVAETNRKYLLTHLVSFPTITAHWLVGKSTAVELKAFTHFLFKGCITIV